MKSAPLANPASHRRGWNTRIEKRRLHVVMRGFLDDRYECVCDEEGSFYGPQCEHINPCRLLQPCLNGASCVNMSDTEYTCRSVRMRDTSTCESTGR